MRVTVFLLLLTVPGLSALAQTPSSANSALATPTIVQSASKVYAQNLTGTVAISNVTAGNCLVVIVAHRNFGANGSGTTVSDGTVFALAYREVGYGGTSSDFSIEAFYLLNAGSGTHTIKVTSRWGTAANSYGNIWVAEISNIAAASALDQAIGNNGSSQTPTSGSTGPLAQSAEIGFAVVGTPGLSVAGITNPPKGGGTWTSQYADNATADGPLYVASQVTSATTPLSATWGALTTSQKWSAVLFTLKGTSSAPGPWSNQDIGAVGATGSSIRTKNSDGTTTFTVKGSGADIWGTSDAFQFNYQALTGNGMITARVASQTPTDPWAKAGVMIRETLDSSSRYAFTDITPAHGIAFERRTATGSQSVHTLGALTTEPYWVRLSRNANTFSAYASADGTTWDLVGQATISMAANVFIGLAVTSHHAGVLSTAAFDHVVAPSSTITAVTFDWPSHLRMAPGSDNWPTTWSNDDNQYAMWGDGDGFGGNGNSTHTSLGVARIKGDSQSYQGINVYGGIAPACPAAAQDMIQGKSHGAPLSLKGVLYAWITPGSDASGYQSFSLYKSLDKGCHWAKLGVSFARTTYGISFGGFVQFGKDNGSAIDSYVYTVATAVSNASDLNIVQRPGSVLLLRVPAASIEVQGMYEFFTGLVNAQPTWSSDVSKAKAVYQDPAGVGPFAQMSYVPELGRFVYTNQHGNGSDASGTHSLLTMAQASRPWGPWSVFYRDLFGATQILPNTLFQWNFAPKWYREGGSSFTLIFTGTGQGTNDSWNTVDGTFTISP